MLVAILVLAVLIFVHELGHFLVAKFYKVGVLEFAIGFGPKLFRIQGKETTYTLRAIPLGGFVRMTGDDPRLLNTEAHPREIIEEGVAGGASAIEGTQTKLTQVQQEMLKDQSRWFLKQGYLAKCAIVFAGPLFNFLFAWVLAAGLCFWIGIPDPNSIVDSGPVIVGEVTPGLPAEKAGIKSGDRIKSIDGKELTIFKELVETVQQSGGKELVFVLERPQKSETGQATPETFETLTIPVKPSGSEPEIDIIERKESSTQNYRIGLARMLVGLTYKPAGFLESWSLGAKHVVNISTTTLMIFKGLIKGELSPAKTLGGPIEIIKQTAMSVKAGLPYVIEIMILLNVSLGVMNLLPIPVLDGGHLLLFTLERIKGRKLSFRFQEIASQFGMAMLLLLLVFAIGNDLRKLIAW